MLLLQKVYEVDDFPIYFHFLNNISQNKEKNSGIPGQIGKLHQILK